MVSIQYRWQQRMRKLGACPQCGHRLGSRKSYCDKCSEQRNAAARRLQQGHRDRMAEVERIALQKATQHKGDGRNLSPLAG